MIPYLSKYQLRLYCTWNHFTLKKTTVRLNDRKRIICYYYLLPPYSNSTIYYKHDWLLHSIWSSQSLHSNPPCLCVYHIHHYNYLYANVFVAIFFSQMHSSVPLPQWLIPVLPTTMMTSQPRSTTPITNGSVSFSSSKRFSATSPSGCGKPGSMGSWTPSSVDWTLDWGLKKRRTRRRAFWLTTWFVTWM